MGANLLDEMNLVTFILMLEFFFSQMEYRDVATMISPWCRGCGCPSRSHKAPPGDISSGDVNPEEDTASEMEPMSEVEFDSQPSPDPGRTPAQSPESSAGRLLSPWLEMSPGPDCDTEEEEEEVMKEFLPLKRCLFVHLLLFVFIV